MVQRRHRKNSSNSTELLKRWTSTVIVSKDEDHRKEDCTSSITVSAMNLIDEILDNHHMPSRHLSLPPKPVQEQPRKCHSDDTHNSSYSSSDHLPKDLLMRMSCLSSKEHSKHGLNRQVNFSEYSKLHVFNTDP